MALADIPTHGQPRRLDSWKEIAEYLGRDVRTATRWESQGMPLHRVPGGKGSSVFAFTHEIDAWMAGNGPERAAAAAAAAPAPPGADPVATPPPAHRRHRIILAAVGGALVTTLAAFALLTRGESSEALDESTLAVTATEEAVTIADASGASRVIHTFRPESGVLIRGRNAAVLDIEHDGTPDVVVAVCFYRDPTERSVRSGALINLDTDGTMRWRFAFYDVLHFNDEPVSHPWALSDWQALTGASHARIAVAGHHYTWWASMVAILDGAGRRLSTFVNPGWVEQVLWLGTDRLAIAGFNNSRNEAMLALLDANDAGGQAPGTAGTAFACTTCATRPPLFYATFPRSELNLLTAGRFNRARVALVGDRLLATTTEIDDDAPATAIYELDMDLRLVRARYSETYWDVHRRLELEGRIAHTRETCPERDGPPAIHVWAAQGGWTRTLPAAKNEPTPR